MATTVVVRGSGGTLFEMDVPAGGTLLDRGTRRSRAASS